MAWWRPAGPVGHAVLRRAGLGGGPRDPAWRAATGRPSTAAARRACQDRVALSPLDLHLDSAIRAWGLWLLGFRTGNAGQESGCQVLGEASALFTSCSTHEPCLI
jgi:hypothetical protein